MNIEIETLRLNSPTLGFLRPRLKWKLRPSLNVSKSTVVQLLNSKPAGVGGSATRDIVARSSPKIDAVLGLDADLVRITARSMPTPAVSR